MRPLVVAALLTSTLAASAAAQAPPAEAGGCRTRVGPNASVTYRFQDPLVTSLRVNYFDVRLNDTDTFKTAVVGFTGTYSFTPRIYVATQIQYDDDTENVSSNVRFAWLDTEHLGSLASTGIESGPQQRQLIVKYTRQFDFTR